MKEEEPPQWRHNQQLNFDGARHHLTLLAQALQQAIDSEKERLRHMMGVRDQYKK